MRKIYAFLAMAILVPCLLQAQTKSISKNFFNTNSTAQVRSGPSGYTGGYGRDKGKSKTGINPSRRGASGTMNGPIITWVGSEDDDWDNPNNWDLGIVPGYSDIVVIPSNPGFNYPYIYGEERDIEIGGLIMDGTFLGGDMFGLTIYDTIYLGNAEINAASIDILNVNSPQILNSTLSTESSIQILNFLGTTNIANNYFEGGVSISDSPMRSDTAEIFGNEFDEDLTLINNSDYGEMYLACSESIAVDKIGGHLTITNNATGNIYVGNGIGGNFGTDIGEPLQVEGAVSITETTDLTVHLSKITFAGYGYPHLSVPGPYMVASGPGFLLVPFGIDSLMFRKNAGTGLVLDQPIMIDKYLLMGTLNSAIVTQDDKMLHIADNCVVVDVDPVHGSFIEGPVKKIGDDAFTFPIGRSIQIMGRSGNPGGVRSSSRQMSGDFFFKAPLSISKPSNDEFVAEFRLDPSSDGYDVLQVGPGIENILEGGYWMLQHPSGSSNVEVSLTYDEVHTGEAIDTLILQVAGWDGTRWVSLNRGVLTGDGSRGTIATGSALTSYGPLALMTSSNIRKPIITIAPLPDSIFCVEQPIMLHFTLDTLAYEGNEFIVELSDENGIFDSYNPVLGRKTTNTSDSISIVLPYYHANGSNYRIRVVGNLPSTVSANTIAPVSQNVPIMSLALNGADSICLNTGVAKYYLSEKEAGVTYTWSVSKGTFTTNNDTAFVTFTTPGVGRVEVLLSNKCGVGSDEGKYVEIKPGTPASTPLLTNVGRWLYVSEADAAQGVTAYKWFKDGILMSGVTGLSYYASEAGNFTVLYANECGDGPISNAINFAAASVPQTITFDSIPDKTYGDDPFGLPATASSGLPVSYTILSGPGNVTSGVFTITQTGTVVIRAMQVGDNTYDTAAYVTRSFVISKAQQTITFDSIPDFIFKGYNQYIYPHATATSGLQIQYQSSAPNVSVYTSAIRIEGLGSVTVTATQPGDTNYLPANPVSHTFCVRVAALEEIEGAQYVCPGQPVVYHTNKIEGLTYLWRLADGTTYPSTADTAEVTFSTAGTYQLLVSATGPCGPATSIDTFTVTVKDGVTTPAAVTNMLPADGSIDQRLPLVLSWLPGDNALSYDLYLWEDGAAKPTTPYKANLTSISYTLPKDAPLTYDKIYHWQVVSKTGCLQTDGPEQVFRLRKASDLVVTQVQAPGSANSGQTITISWTVKNTGAGNTLTEETWTDAVFLSFDSMPHFNLVTTYKPAWDALDFPSKPLLIGTKTKVAALNTGQEYINTIDFTIPRGYTAPMYVYVVTDYPDGPDAPPQSDYSNDTARSVNAVVVLPTPTPDLRVDTVLVPATTFSGSIINVTYKVTNYGVLTPVGEYWTDKIYISKSPLFNKEVATLLKLPNYGNKMHYPADDATITNGAQLQEDSSVTRSVQVRIPDFLSGTWFIHVVANEDQLLYESALANNNDNNSVLQVILTPTPQFSLSEINVPLTTLSNTQTIGLNWNVHNLGFFDKIEEDKGFYRITTWDIYCGSTKELAGTGRGLHTAQRDGGHDSGQIPGERDSLSWGSSYWVDKVYLSTDPSGLNTANAIYLGKAVKGFEDLGWRVPNTIIQGRSHCLELNYHGYVPGITTDNVLRPGSNHANSFNFNVPDDLPQGDYYFYVQTNATNSVFTYPDAPVIRRSEMITIVHPDLAVNSLSVPATLNGGTAFTLDYTLINNGPGGVYEANRKDKIFVSNSPVFDASNATLLETVKYKEDVPVGDTILHHFTYTFPNETSGVTYFFIQTNADSAFIENDFGNNVSAAVSSNISTAPPTDLLISQITAPDSAKAPGQVQLVYEIQNNGANPVSGMSSLDSIFVSCSPVFDRQSVVFVAVQEKNRNIPVGNSVLDTVNVSVQEVAYRMNACFDSAVFSNATFFIKVNAGKTIYEAADTTNNITGSNQTVLINQNADLIPHSLSGEVNAIVGRPYLLSWKVTNLGKATSIRSWRYDSLFFSMDSVYNGNAIPFASFNSLARISTGDTVNNAINSIIPKMPTGDYYVFVVVNAKRSITNEWNFGNNIDFLRDGSGAAIQIHVVQPLLSDLQSAINTAPASVAIGQPMTVIYQVNNAGAGITYPDKWGDEIWLSTGTKPNRYTDTRLFGKTHTGNLNAGEYYMDTVSVFIPMNTPEGNYLLISKPDERNVVIEANDTNNLALKPITVYVPAPSDLIVESISIPDTVFLGERITQLSWIVKNASANAAEGVSTDGIYISKNPVYDSAALLLGIRNKDNPLSPLETDTLVQSPIVDNVPEGYYRVIVRTDIQNNIYETDKSNNAGVSPGVIYVAVRELVLGIPQAGTLESAKYYKLHIPDSLLGSTVLLSLTSEDSLTHNNEVYVGGGYVPSVFHYDYKFDQPNYGNQNILLAEITDSVYYITLRCVSPDPGTQNITLSARVLPFAILEVASERGGNAGNVTVQISGSLFTDSMSAKLTGRGATINATNVYFVNSTLAYATFPLLAQPIGVYDLTLVKTDLSEATLADGFSVVSPDNGGLYSGGGVNTGQVGYGTAPGCDPGSPAGKNAQLVTELIIPETVFEGLPFEIQINFSNPTNMDIPVQSKVLYNDFNLPMSLTKGVYTNSSGSLYIEFTETDGPPGVLRAGSSGSIKVYCKVLNSIGHEIVKFNLK